MKCTRCGTKMTQKELALALGRCKRCGHIFVFNPKGSNADRFTDFYFKKTLDRLSVNARLSFTKKQLLYFLNRCLYPRRTSSIRSSESSTAALAWLNESIRRHPITWIQLLGGAILLFGIGFGIVTNSAFIYGLATLVGLGLFWFSFFQNRKLPAASTRTIPAPPPTPPPTFNPRASSLVLTPQQIETWLQRWQTVNDPLETLLPPVERSSALPTRSAPGRDITAYSFDRAIICDRPEIAQLLIANNFHFENNCAILSVTGYPEEIFSTVREMLQNNQNLQVYAFHDFSPQGVRLIPRLRNSATWFRGRNIPIIDVGLTGKQVLSARPPFQVHCTSESFTRAQSLTDDIRATLSSEVLNWLLQGKFVELESFSPKKIIRVLQRSLSQGGQLLIEGDDSTVMIDRDDRDPYERESFG